MAIYGPFARRLQLLELGYIILPNLDKRCMLKGWPSQEFLRRELKRAKSWEVRFPQFRSTGLRIQNGLAVIDIDVDDEVMVEAILEMIRQHAPDIADYAPTRYGGGRFKIALFVRTSITAAECAKMTMRSRKYRRPGDEDGHHAVEIFLSQAGSSECHRQFGIDGPHSYYPDGKVKAEYVWAEGVPALWEIKPQDLPVLGLAAARTIVDGFDAIAQRVGWAPLSEAREASDGVIIRDIDEHTRFDLENGSQVDYAGLAAGMRCTSSFHGEAGANPTKCQVDRIRVLGNVLGVWDHEEGAWHAPVPVDISADLKAIAAEAGLELPLAEPNWRDRYKGGRPRPSLDNALLALVHSDIHCTLDTFHSRAWIGRSDAAAPGPLPAFCGEVTDANVLGLRVWLNRRYGFDLGETNVRDAVMAQAQEHAFDPVVEMLAEAEANWDGKSRLDRLAHDYFNAEDTEVNRQCVRKTMIAAVARARTPGIKFDTILVMESVEGYNKSSAWALLAGEGNFSDSSILGQAGREVQEQLAGIWIHENAELAGMRKAEVETIKAFASRQEDRARPAYGHFLVAQPRHSIEVGTTNSSEYLQSPNGNRRFWPIRVERPIDLVKLRAARLQIWGEAAHYQAKGESLVLEERLWPLVGAIQEDRRVRHPWEAILARMTRRVPGSALDGADFKGNTAIINLVGTEERVSTADVFNYLAIPLGQLHTGHAKTLADCMRQHGWTTCVFKQDGKAVRGYRRT